MKRSNELNAIDIAAVQSRMLTIRNQQVLLDRDVAALYGVETKALNQAVTRNAEKFPAGKAKAARRTIVWCGVVGVGLRDAVGEGACGSFSL